ncbi:MAG: tetratricopeptide repeat protein, partial [Microscillaceae bacterium]|nr:tetratricopeptide repeat protein [Microscillaceae bacterium]
MKLLKQIKSFFEFEKRALFNSGVNKIQKHDFAGAVDVFNEVIREAPSYEAYQNRAAAYSRLSQYELAIQDLQRAIQMNPKLPEAHLGLGVINTRMGNLKGAIDCYNEVINLAPGHTIAYTNRGFVKFQMLDYRGAIADFDEAIELNDKNA